MGLTAFGISETLDSFIASVEFCVSACLEFMKKEHRTYLSPKRKEKHEEQLHLVLLTQVIAN